MSGKLLGGSLIFLSLLGWASAGPAHDAARGGNLAKVKRLIESKQVLVDSKEPVCGWTMLHIACQEDNLEMIAYLLKQGATVDSRDSNKETPLCAAAGGGHAGAMKLLLDHGADPYAKGNFGTVMERMAIDGAASEEGRVAAFRLLVERKVNFRTFSDGSAPFHFLAAQDHIPAMEYLLSVGQEVDFPNQSGSTALQLAAGAGRTRAVTFLLDKGANINAPDPNGSTALHKAAASGSGSVVSLLLSRGADPELRNKSGLRASDLAQARHPELLPRFNKPTPAP